MTGPAEDKGANPEVWLLIRLQIHHSHSYHVSHLTWITWIPVQLLIVNFHNWAMQCSNAHPVWKRELLDVHDRSHQNDPLTAYGAFPIGAWHFHKSQWKSQWVTLTFHSIQISLLVQCQNWCNWCNVPNIRPKKRESNLQYLPKIFRVVFGTNTQLIMNIRI